MGDEGGDEDVWILRTVRPAAGIPRKDVPDIGNIGAGEDGEDGECDSPNGHQDYSDDARAVFPCPLLEHAQKLKEEAELDKGRGKVERDVDDVEQRQILRGFGDGKQKKVAARAVLDSWTRNVSDRSDVVVSKDMYLLTRKTTEAIEVEILRCTSARRHSFGGSKMPTR